MSLNFSEFLSLRNELEAHLPSGLKTKAKANIDAIRTYVELNELGQNPTQSDRLKASKFTGMGGLKYLFEETNEEWYPLHEELVNLLPTAEYETLRGSILNAHYTSPEIVKCLWMMARTMGFNGGKVLSPSFGMGYFKLFNPYDDLYDQCEWTAIELDKVTAGLARIIHPDALFYNSGFESVALPENHYDLVIDNFPFGDYKVSDKLYPEFGHLHIHNFFFAKSMKLLRPGGLLIAITSSGTLGSEINYGFRCHLKSQANLVAAYRLPSNAFKAFNTEVTTDVLVFQKLDPENDILPDEEFDWTELKNAYLYSYHSNKYLNMPSYYARYEEHHLGYMLEDKLWPGRLACVARPDQNTFDLLSQLALKLPRIYLPNQSDGNSQGSAGDTDNSAITVIPEHLQHIPNYSFFEHEGRLYQRLERSIHLVEGASLDRIRRMTHLARLLEEVLEAQKSPDDIHLFEIQADLRHAYDEFVELYGRLRSKANWDAFAQDGRIYLLQSLEVEVRQEGSRKVDYKQADIFFKRTARPNITPNISSAKDAMMVCLNQLGKFDPAHTAHLLGTSVEDLIDELETEDCIFYNPATETHETADEYLSGNVVIKLTIARQHVTQRQSLQRNIDALEKVQPLFLLPPASPDVKAEVAIALGGEEKCDLDPGAVIEARLGSPWISPEVIQEFVAFLIECYPTRVKVRHAIGNNNWAIVLSDYERFNTKNSSVYGTPDFTATELIECCLNSKEIAVYDNIELPDGTKKRVKNAQKSQTAQAKAKQIKEVFRTWLWQDRQRALALTIEYNRRFNQTIERKYDGSHLTFPGMAPGFRLRQSQKNGVWQCICNPATLIAHCVGAGKTSLSIAAVMEMKRLGIVDKPMIVVLNSTLSQFEAEFRRLYPAARLLVPTKEDFQKHNRRRLIATIATWDWDCIIIPASQFSTIQLNRETQLQYLAIEQQAVNDDLAAFGRDRKSFVTKALERKKKGIDKKINDLRNAKIDEGSVSWEQLSVDCLVVDECFPYETKVTTEIGELPIGLIVENKLPLRVLSYNKSTGQTEWKSIVRWMTKPLSHQLVKVNHNSGSFVCTDNHKIWTTEHGYIEAGKLQAGAALQVLSGSSTKQWQKSEALLQQEMRESLSVISEKTDHKNLPSLRDRFSVSIEGENKGFKTNLLQWIVRQNLSIPATWDKRSVFSTHSPISQRQKAWFCERTEGAETARVFGTDEKQQSNAISGNSRKGGCSKTGKTISYGKGWQWQIFPDTNTAISSVDQGILGSNFSDGICGSNQTRKSGVREDPELLQNRYCNSVIDDSNRSRWQLPCCTESTGARSEEDHSLGISRVVSVENYQPGSDGEYWSCAGKNSFVYDIEVEDNHNFFAENVTVSNCHLRFKKPGISTKMNGIAGIDTSQSQRGLDMFMKVHQILGDAYLLESSKDFSGSDEEILQQKASQKPGRVIFMTGTPITNSIGELYTIQRYLQLTTLRDAGIAGFDAWVLNFGEVVTAPEISPTGKYQVKSRFSRFTNLPKLIGMYRLIASVVSQSDLRKPMNWAEISKDMTDEQRIEAEKLFVQIPDHTLINVAAEPSPDQQAYMQKLLERSEKIKAGEVDPKDDNMLVVTGDGRKSCIDMRLVSRHAANWLDSKINKCAVNVFKIWKSTEDLKLTQAIFCDFSTPKDGKVFDVYTYLRDLLVDMGIPREQIKFAHEYATPEAKLKFYDEFNRGERRIFITSTEKGATGTNIQRRLVAVHHIDAPWRPADIEQRDGRILRVHNLCPHVFLFRYVTEGTSDLCGFDSFLWQGLETKARYIEQIMNASSGQHTVEDVGGTALTYAELKALASGDPRIVRKAVVDQQVQELSLVLKGLEAQLTQCNISVGSLPKTIDRYADQLARYESDFELVSAWNNHEAVVKYSKEELDELKAIAKANAVDKSQDQPQDQDETEAVDNAEDNAEGEGEDESEIVDGVEVVKVSSSKGKKDTRVQYKPLFYPITIYQGADEPVITTDVREAGELILEEVNSIQDGRITGRHQIGYIPILCDVESRKEDGFKIIAEFRPANNYTVLYVSRQSDYQISLTSNGVQNIRAMFSVGHKIQDALHSLRQTLNQSKGKFKNLAPQIETLEADVRKYRTELEPLIQEQIELDALLNISVGEVQVSGADTNGNSGVSTNDDDDEASGIAAFFGGSSELAPYMGIEPEITESLLEKVESIGDDWVSELYHKTVRPMLDQIFGQVDSQDSQDDNQVDAQIGTNDLSVVTNLENLLKLEIAEPVVGEAVTTEAVTTEAIVDIGIASTSNVETNIAETNITSDEMTDEVVVDGVADDASEDVSDNVPENTPSNEEDSWASQFNDLIPAVARKKKTGSEEQFDLFSF